MIDRYHLVGQVQNYVDYMVVWALDGKPDAVKGRRDAAEAPRVVGIRPETEASRLFTADGRALVEIRAQSDSGAAAADALLLSAVAPSKQLMKLAATDSSSGSSSSCGQEQAVAYRLVLNAVEQAIRGDHKSVVIVTGGPGSGKSVIALSLLGEIYRRGRTARACDRFQGVYRDAAQGGGRPQQAGPGPVRVLQPIRARPAELVDMLILDEAHRLRRAATSASHPRASGPRCRSC